MSVDLPINPSTRGPETFVATAGQTTFTGGYPVQEAADVVVETSLDGGQTWTAKTLGVDYTLTPAGTGFTIMFAAGRADGEKVRHYGRQVVKNTTDFSPANTLKRAGLNAKLDRLTMADQELARDVGRALKVAIGQAAGTLTVGAAGETLIFDGAGNVVPGADQTDIINVQGYAAAAQQAATDAQQAATDAQQAAALLGTVAAMMVSALTELDITDVPVNVTHVRVAGYAQPGDGGAALWKAVPTEPAHAGKRQSANGRWFEYAEEEIRPKAWGAKGDGVTSDDAVFVAIGQACTNGYFKRVTLQKGEYRLNTATPVDFNGVDGLVIVGPHRDSCKIKFDTGTAPYPFVVRNSDGLRISGIHFSNVATNVPGVCLAISNVNDHVIENNRFSDATFYGVVIAQDVLDGLGTAGTCNRSIIRYNEFVDIGCIGLEPFPKVLSDRQEIYGNVFKECGNNPNSYVSSECALKCGQAYQYSNVYDNIIIGASTNLVSAFGMAAGGGHVTDVHNNIFIDVPSFGIVTTLGTHPLFPTLTTKNLTVRNNLFFYSDGHPTSQAAIALNGDMPNNGPIIYEGNVILNGYRGISYEGSAANVPNVIVRNNFIDGARGGDFIVLGLSTGGCLNPIVEGNMCINRDLNATHARITIQNCSGARVRRNTIKNAGIFAIQFSEGTGPHYVEDNIIDGYNVNNTSSLGAIHAHFPSSQQLVFVRGNKLVTGSGNPLGLVSGGSANAQFACYDNHLDVQSTPILVASGTILEDKTKNVVQYGHRKQYFGTSAPASGSYAQGDIVWNTVPSAGGNIGWVCTVGGSPGTWKTFGTIAA